eukprot:TRINITY_DN3049_c0_g1_i2.p1 TRINITY_DN3049_c0_g1~~TRINITY_DN3049_c0_g1_i2.p1  ORF type:complete len:179 (+),score=37.47 TRINITY_DN3049_c0_g1_i2:367-903(+)
MKEVINEMGGLDVCVANAGSLGHFAPFNKYPQNAFEDTINNNLGGCFNTLKAATSHLIRKRSGSLIAVGSIVSEYGMPYNPAYAITKQGMEIMMRGLSVELAKYNIRANTIKPGWVETDMTKHNLDSEEFKEKVLPRVPLKRWGNPEDLKGIVVYLASDASKYHTGDTITIDGGFTKF